jgi:Flp pilus assembly pilin Flp
MSDLVLLTAVRVKSTLSGFVQDLAARIADDERGQDTIEYIGVLLIVAALIAVVVGIVQTKLGSTIESGASSLINKVFAGKG